MWMECRSTVLPSSFLHLELVIVWASASVGYVEHMALHHITTLSYYVCIV